MSDHYRTLAATAEARIKIERSDFLAIAFPVTADEPFFAALEAVQKKYFDATHHCWAFRLFAGARSRSSDAGEPSGSAGKPILAAIEGAGVHDTGVIVVRWYGGVKLGTGGLSRAYRDTAAAALQEAVLLDRYVYARVVVDAAWDDLNTVYRLVEPPDVILANENFGERAEFTFDVRQSRCDAFCRNLTEKRLAWRVIASEPAP
jgi:uncharacterized YigZ family protein